MKWRNPFPTVDIVVETWEGIVLVRRKNPPEGWALPGGFIERGERVEDAAIREAFEETGLHVKLRHLLYVYSEPSRDPRFHTMSVVFIGHATGKPRGGDDAAEARSFPLDQLPSPLAFDHQEIIQDYIRFRQHGQIPLPTPSKQPERGAE